MRAALLLLATACGVNQTPQPEPVPVLPSCIPDRDGAITAGELPIAIGSTATYYTGTNRTFDSTGTSGIWDLSEERADDEVIALGPIAIGAQWYAASFAGAQFVIDGGGGLDGVYHQDDQALWLHGLASRTEAPKTLVRYAQPIAVLRFPVIDGDAFSSTGVIADGVIAGLPFVGTDQVDVDVTGTGRLDVPYVRFSPVLRVRTRALRTPSSGTPQVTRRTTLFLFECFGEVVRAESQRDEADPDFTTAAYLRRFALGVTP